MNEKVVPIDHISGRKRIKSGPRKHRGSPPPEVGIAENIPAEIYHSWTGHGPGRYYASASRLKSLIERTPAHLKAELDGLTGRTESASMRMGTLADLAILTPGEFCRFQPYPSGMRRDSKEFGILAEKFGAENLVKESEYNAAIAMAQAVLKHKTAERLISHKDSITQVSLVWDDDTGVRCKARPDLFVEGLGEKKLNLLVDLKTTADAGSVAFAKSIFNFGYYRQLAFYKRGLEKFGIRVDACLILAVENEPPYCVAVKQLANDALLAGEQEVVRALRLWAKCEASGEWPGYGDAIDEIGIPAWGLNQINDRTMQGGMK